MAPNDLGLRSINRLDVEEGQEVCEVVVVHGLYGSNHRSWTDIKWEDEFLPSLDGGTRHRLSLFTYDVFGLNGGILTRGGARDEAMKLLDSLLELRDNGFKRMPIMFIAHDIGGSLVKEVVILAQQRKYEDIYTSIYSMVFLGCPHQGLKADLQSGCADLLMSHKRTTYSEAWGLSGPLVEWVEATNNAFAESRISAIAAMSTSISIHPDSRERVFDQFATSMLGEADLFKTDLAHENLLKYPRLNIIGEINYRIDYPSKVALPRHINSIVSQVSPQYVIDTTRLAPEQPGLSAFRETFLGFINSDGAGRLLVHALGSPGCSAVETAEQVLKWTDDLHQAVSYAFFSFDADDGRRNSAVAALSSIFTELCNQSPNEDAKVAAKATLASLDICHSIQVEDLYAVYMDLVLHRLSSWPTGSSKLYFAIILGNLDGRIRGGTWLFRKLEEIVSGCDLRLKIVVTSSDPSSLTSDGGSVTSVGWMQDTKSLAVLSSGLGPSTISNGPEKEQNSAEGETEGSKTATAEDGRNEIAVATTTVLALIQDRPQLYSCSAALILLAQSCEKDVELWKIIANWLRDVQLPGEGRLQDFISQLVPATPNKVFAHMLTSVPAQVRSWSILLLERVLFAFRPLSLLELLDLELLDGSDEPQQGLPGTSTMRGVTERVCGGLLTIRRGEVRLAHPKLRDYLLTSTEQSIEKWLPLDSEAQIHGRIATDCLNYLASPKKRELMEHRAGPGGWHTPFECRDDFLSYAVKYWLPHAARAGGGIFESDVCARFLADDAAVGLWVTLYQELSPRVTNWGMPPVNILASLSIFAEHGAEDLLVSSIKKHQELGTGGLNLACLAALVEAAGAGNVRIVRELLTFPLPDGEPIDQAIVAAIESGREDVFLEITSRGRTGLIQDFTRLLARAASLGHSEFVKVLLDMMRASGVDSSGSDGFSPLSYACQRGYGDVVQLLIREGGATVTSELETRGHSLSPLPIRLAVEFGKSGILEILRSAAVKQPEDPVTTEHYRSVFFESSRFGRRGPVRDILKYISRKLQRDTSAPGVHKTDVSDGTHEDNAVMKYLCFQVIQINPSDDPNYSAISRAIELWPHAIDLVDFLTRPERGIYKDPQFPSFFELGVKTAIRSCDLAVVKLVFENGAKSQWATAEILERAATVGFEAALSSPLRYCMDYLIQRGADIRSRMSEYERTPLFHAAYRGFIEVAKILIEAKVDVNEKGDDTWYPIHACYDNANITRQLIDVGANIDVLTTPDDGEHIPSLWYATAWNFHGVVDELLKAKPSRETIQSGIKAAVEKNRPDMIEKLLTHCPDASYLPDIEDLLHSQVSCSSLKNLQLLLGERYQLDPDKRDSHGNTALHYISANTSAEVVELLLTRGANLELVNDRGYTPLAVAAEESTASVVQLLVEHGARINTADGSNGGPFIFACLNGTLDMVKIMHTSKADPAEVNSLRPGSMGTPINAALLRREETAAKQEIIQYLLEEGHAEVNIGSMFWSGALQIACLTSTVETVRMLIERYHADVNDVDNTGRTPLHIALYRTREHVRLLLEHGADLDAVDIIGRNALHCAVLSGRLDVVKLVLDERPQFVDREDAHGWTPLLWALRPTGMWGTQTSEMQAIVQELLDRGARRLVRGQGVDRTWTPMTTAKYYRVCQEITDLLTPTPEDLEKTTDDDREWDWKSGGGKRGVMSTDESGWCDHCLLGCCGLSYICMSKGCDGRVTAYCLHCYLSWDKLHTSGHQEFDIWGAEEDDASNAGDSSPEIVASESAIELDEQLEVGEEEEQGEEEGEGEEGEGEEGEGVVEGEEKGGG